MEARIKYLTRKIEQNEVGLQDATDALALHLSQLERLGCHLEDSICEILRKVIAQAEARQELAEISAELRKTSPF